MATEVTVAAEVLHVPDPVIAPVPLPVRHPVRVEAPVPPLATVRAFVRLSVPIHEFVDVWSVVVAFENVLSPVHVLLFASNVVEATVIFAEPSKDTPFMVLAVSNTVALPAVKLAPVPVIFVPTRASGVPSHELPDIVSCVVEALASVVAPVTVSVPFIVALPEETKVTGAKKAPSTFRLPATLTFPAKVEVAVVPSLITIALVNVCVKSQRFAVVVPKASAIVPVVVIVPPVTGYVVAIDETEAFEVLHVPDPVIAPVPLPVRHPVRVEAPVPPFATESALVRLSVPIHEVVEV